MSSIEKKPQPKSHAWPVFLNNYQNFNFHAIERKCVPSIFTRVCVIQWLLLRSRETVNIVTQCVLSLFQLSKLKIQLLHMESESNSVTWPIYFYLGVLGVLINKHPQFSLHFIKKQFQISLSGLYVMGSEINSISLITHFFRTK